jgi:hypothetical protein|tara:strand:+ start:123 stop:386 length:264 start_codon:yes stop_codon:yes gene_type:complete
MKVGDLVKSKFSFFEGQLGLIIQDDVWGEEYWSTQHSRTHKWCSVKLLCNGEARLISSEDMEVVKRCQENVKSGSNTLRQPSQRVTL